MAAVTPLERYTRAAAKSSSVVIGEYSTSFGLATRVLPPLMRDRIRALYALVRLADEVVDGVAAQSGLSRAEIARAIEALEAETHAALETGYSANLVVHAFAATAREVGIDESLTGPFFASMRMDVERAEHTPGSFATYVDGSAEVVGLMCLKVFEVGHRRDELTGQRLERGARRLGAAFQKVNFLRDLGADADGLGRAYFPGVSTESLDDETKHRLLDDIDADLDAAAAVLPLLDRGPRRAVALAHGLFAALSARIRRVPAAELKRTRVRVPDAVKARLAVLALTDRLPRRQRETAGVRPRPIGVAQRTVGAGAGRRAVVIGGGISGLASAALLAAEGYAVTVLEAQDAVGGRAGEWTRAGYRFETGPSWYLMPEVFDHFFRLLGTTADAELQLTKLDPGYRVVFEPGAGGVADRVDVQADRGRNLELAERLEAGAGKRLGTYLDSAAWMYEMAKRYFLYTTFASLKPMLQRDVLRGLPRLVPMLTGSLSTYVERRFRDPRLRQILEYPAVFLGNAPYSTPSMFHLMSTLDFEQGVLYPAGGIRALIDAVQRVAEREGVVVRTRTAAARILTERQGGTARATGVVTADGEVVPADVVVSTMDLEAAERTLLPPELHTYPARYWAKRTPGPSAVIVLLGVRGELPDLLHHTLLFTRDWKANFGAVMPKRGRPRPPLPDELSLYVCRPSATDDVAPPGSENLFLLIPMTADPSIGHGGVDGAGDAQVEAIADRAIGQIAEWLDVPDLPERIEVRRTIGPADFARDLNAWQGTALGPAHTLTQSALFRAGNASRHVENLLFAGGSTIPGIGLPMCVISAELIIKRLRGDESAGPLAEPLVPVRVVAAVP